jgi:putative membrane protein
MKALYLVSMAIALGLTLPVNAAKSVSNQLSSNESAIIKDLAGDGLLEVKLGQLAEKNASSTAVKDFGKRMVQDHSQANEKLMAAAKQLNLDLPHSLNSQQVVTEQSLARLRGKDFDKTYISDMVKDHQKAVEVVQKEASTGSEPFKAWAAQTLPTIKQHLQLAEDMKSRMM